MNKEKAPRLAAVCAAFALSCPPTFAVETTLPTPSPSAFADTESSTNIPFAGWNDLTRFMNISAEVFASLASCVQIAFGTDHNDGDLTIDETDLVLGYDCGTWFIRDERNGHERTEDASNQLSGDFIQRIFTALTAPRYDNIHQENGMLFSHDWNLMKITTRGDQTLAPTLGLEFKNNPFVFILK